jgi:5,5'-dehydrodivanillate O-demethylase
MEPGKVIAVQIILHDMLAWVAQGPISDRTREHLATSDRGVVLYHKLLMEQMARVARGGEPMAIIRDRAENEPMIALQREHGTLGAFDSRYRPHFDQISETTAKSA